MNMKDLFLSFEKRKEFSFDKKARIARKALPFITPGDEFFLGAGTTVSFFGEELAKSSRHFMLKIWTNNLFLVNLWLNRHEKFSSENFIGVTAGEISRRNLSIVNLIAPFSHVEKAVIGTSGISLKGMSSDDMYTVQQMDFLIKRVRKVIILADCSKIGRDCTYITRSIRMIKLDLKQGKEYVLVTDPAPKNEKVKAVLDKFKAMGFRIVETD